MVRVDVGMNVFVTANVLSIAYLLAYSDTGSILLRIRIRRQHFQACSQVAGFGSANAKFRG